VQHIKISRSEATMSLFIPLAWNPRRRDHSLSDQTLHNPMKTP
jgi:hypothetical protein